MQEWRNSILSTKSVKKISKVRFEKKEWEIRYQQAKSKREISEDKKEYQLLIKSIKWDIVREKKKKMLAQL